MARKFNSSDPTASKAIGLASETDRRRPRVSARFEPNRAVVTGPADLMPIHRGAEWSSAEKAWTMPTDVAVDVIRAAERQRFEVVVSGNYATA